MGMCPSVEVREQINLNDNINKELWNDKVIDMATIKLLLLGSGECGKSTILKQLQILHSDGFNASELRHWRSIVYSNTVTSMMLLCQAVKELDLMWQDPAREADARLVLDSYNNGALMSAMSDVLYHAVKRLWQDAAVLKCYDRRNEFQLTDSAKYYFESLDRFQAPNYMPSTQDILMCRVATTGVTEVFFVIKDNNFRVFDVGGQRSERRKWIHCFDNVHAVIFIVAISEFDQVLAEDGTTNRLWEAMQLYRSILNSIWFNKSSMVLFLNKRDLFREKLNAGKSIRYCFRDYEGKHEYAESVKFIKTKLESYNEKADVKLVYIHETCATDTNQVQSILDSVLDTIIAKNLAKSGVV